MRYRTRKELAKLSLAEVLAALDALGLEPESQRVFLTDGPPDAQGCPTTGPPLAWLHESQKQECLENGSTVLSLEQQVTHQTSLGLWRLQLYSEGVARYVASLGMAKAQRELKQRGAELTVWHARRVTRQEVEKQLCQAIHEETEEEGDEPA